MGEKSVSEKLWGIVSESLSIIGEELTRLGLRIQHEILSQANDVAGENLKVAIPPEGMDLNGYLAKLERAFFEKAIEMKHGNQAAAARLLGFEPHTFRKRAREQFGLEKPFRG